jgi:hypothetical protein
LSTLRGYMTAVNTLFQLRAFKQPTNLSNPSNMPGIIINNLIKEETIASQRSPLDSTIFAELQQAASSSLTCNSDQNLLFDILTLARWIIFLHSTTYLVKITLQNEKNSLVLYLGKKYHTFFTLITLQYHVSAQMSTHG